MSKIRLPFGVATMLSERHRATFASDCIVLILGANHNTWYFNPEKATEEQTTHVIEVIKQVTKENT